MKSDEQGDSRPKCGRVGGPQVHVPVLDWLRDEDQALRPVQFVTSPPAVVVAISFNASTFFRHCHSVLDVQWQAEELHGSVLYKLRHCFVDSMVS